MAIVVVAAGVVPKPGAASLVGLTSGILAAFLGLGDFGALETLLSYTMVGDRRRPGAAAVAQS